MGKLSGTDVGDAGSGMVGELNTSIMEMSASGRHIMSLSALSSAAYGESGKHVMSLSWLSGVTAKLFAGGWSWGGKKLRTEVPLQSL